MVISVLLFVLVLFLFWIVIGQYDVIRELRELLQDDMFVTFKGMKEGLDIEEFPTVEPGSGSFWIDEPEGSEGTKGTR